MTSDLIKVKQYYSAWLDIDDADFDRVGFKLIISKKRDERQEGYGANFIVYCLKTRTGVNLSISSSLADQAKALDIPQSEDISCILEKCFHRPVCARSILYYQYPGVLPERNGAVQLTDENYSDYECFFRSMNPGLTTEGWLKDYYNHLCSSGQCFGFYADGILVSATDAPFIPYMPQCIAEPGINTLPKFRRKGYAKIVCEAFIRHQISLEKTVIWTCRQSNAASFGLACSLGFQKFADLYTLEGNARS